MNKKLLLISLMSFSLLSACGEQTEQEKAQKSAIFEGISILHDMGKMAQEGASDQEIQNATIERVTKSLSTVTDGTSAELTEKEKKALSESAELLKDGAKGLKEEAEKAISQSLNEAENSKK